MKQIFTLFFCLLAGWCWHLPALAATVDTLPENGGAGKGMLVVAVLSVVFGGIYLFFKLKKER